MAGMSGENGGWTGGGHGIGGGEPGRDPGNNGGGGNGNSGNSSNSGIGQSTQGKTDSTSQGRRDDATNSFGGFTDALGDMAEGLMSGVKGVKEGVKDAAKDISNTVGWALGLNKGVTELGEDGWKGPGHESRNLAAHKGLKRGAIRAMSEQGIKTVASVSPLGSPLGIAAKATALGMTPDEERGYKATKSQATGLSSVGGLLQSQLGIPGVTTAINAMDYGRMGSFAKNEFGLDMSKSKGRRETASKSFGNGSGHNNQSLAINTSTTTNSAWNPSSIGFGEYDSHLTGLLS